MSEPIRYSAGLVTAFGAAVRGGYTGTYEQWCQDMADLGANLSEVREKAAQAASNAATANGFASSAMESASAAANSAGAAASHATAAAGSATAAGNAQGAAETAQGAAEAAQGKAEDAQEAAEQAQSNAETAAQSVSQSTAQISQNAADIIDLKGALDTFSLVMEDGKLIDYLNGELSNNYWSLSNKYPIVGGMQVKVSTHIFSGGVIGFFDDSDKMLAYTINPDGTMYSGIEDYILTAPSGSTYVRFSCWKTSKSGAEISVYNLANGTIENLKKASSIAIKKVQASDIIANNLLTRDGSLAATNSWDATDFLPIYPSGDITLNTYIYLNGALCYYDKNKNLLLGIDGNNATDYGYASSTSEQLITVTPPVGTRYIRMCIWKTYGAITDLFALYSAPWNENAQNILETVESVSDVAEGYTDKKVLILGDSISADAYQNYKKWVTNLIDEGKLKFANVVNSSQHATGFVATSNGSYPNFVTRLEGIADKDTFDLVIVFGGINDYIQGIPLGGGSGETDKTTYFKPAVDYFFDYLINNFTQARICVLLPLKTYETLPNSAGNKQEVYANYIHDVAKVYCLPTLNLTEESGFCPFIASFKNKWTLVPSGSSDHDGVHPNAEYEKNYLAPMIWKFISGLID